ASGPVGSLESFTGGAVGLLRYVVPPALAALGVVLIRGPRQGEDDEATVETDLDDLEAVHDGTRSAAVVMFGAVLAVLVLSGALDLLFAEGRTVTDDGLDAYAPGGGLLG